MLEFMKEIFKLFIKFNFNWKLPDKQTPSTDSYAENMPGKHKQEQMQTAHKRYRPH